MQTFFATEVDNRYWRRQSTPIDSADAHNLGNTNMTNYTEAQIAQFAADQRKSDEQELRLTRRWLAENPTGFMSESHRRRIKGLERKLAA